MICNIKNKRVGCINISCILELTIHVTIKIMNFCSNMLIFTIYHILPRESRNYVCIINSSEIYSFDNWIEVVC
jgi:hypothetical protein